LILLIVSLLINWLFKESYSYACSYISYSLCFNLCYIIPLIQSNPRIKLYIISLIVICAIKRAIDFLVLKISIVRLYIVNLYYIIIRINGMIAIKGMHAFEQKGIAWLNRRYFLVFVS
jgi:hypothetical protein